MEGHADGAALLRVGFDAVDLGDQVERFLRLGVLVLLEDLPACVREATRADATPGLREPRVTPRGA
jgi:hypothetical protein